MTLRTASDALEVVRQAKSHQLELEDQQKLLHHNGNRKYHHFAAGVLQHLADDIQRQLAGSLPD